MHTAYVSLFFSAMAGLIYQVTVMDMLFSYFVRTSHTSSIVISVFLAGLGIGSYLVHWYRDRMERKVVWVMGVQTLLAVYSLVVFYNLYAIVPSVHTMGLVLLSVLLILFPTVLLGATFALVSYIVGGDRNITGKVYSLDLVGAVIGSLLSGFFLIPNIGVQASILFAVVFNLVAALVLVRRFLVSVALVAFLVPVLFAYGGFGVAGQVDGQDRSLLPDAYAGPDGIDTGEAGPQQRIDTGSESFEEHTKYGTVRLENGVLYIDRMDQCSYDLPPNASERRIADYSLDQIRADTVLNIGLGCSLTLERILGISNASVDVVEINPAVLEASRLKTNVTFSPRVNVTIDDGYWFLREGDREYDSIIVDVSNPAAAYSSDLYTLEAFREVHDSLDADGTFGLWAYYCRKDGDRVYSIIYNTLNEVFQHVYVIDDSLIIASKQELGYESFIEPKETELNTMDHKILSSYFGEHCSWWKEESADG